MNIRERFMAGDIVRFRSCYILSKHPRQITSTLGDQCFLDDSKWPTPQQMLELVTQRAPHKITRELSKTDTTALPPNTFVKRKGFPPIPMSSAKQGDTIYTVG